MANLQVIVTDRQKTASRELVPIIASSMETCYEDCVAESGKGSFLRMKAQMNSHVDIQKKIMFQLAVDGVTEGLSRMNRDVEKDLSKEIKEVFRQMKQEYFDIIIGDGATDGNDMSEEELTLRLRVGHLVKDADVAFGTIVARYGADEMKVQPGPGEGQVGPQTPNRVKPSPQMASGKKTLAQRDVEMSGTGTDGPAN